MNRANYHFMMMGVVTRLDERLGIDIAVRRPVDKPDRQKIGLFREQAELGRKNEFVWIETFKDGDFRPIAQSQFGLDLVRIGNPFVLNLETQREITFRLEVWRGDLVQPFGGRE